MKENTQIESLACQGVDGVNSAYHSIFRPCLAPYPLFLVLIVSVQLWHFNVGWLNFFSLLLIYIVLEEGGKLCLSLSLESFFLCSLVEHDLLLVFKVDP